MLDDDFWTMISGRWRRAGEGQAQTI